ncbi:MAG: hypothetical protein KAW12_18950 [Candidatus Aminicenantes bacterium]|nr:hypothetical protein [Candidatus Aminicenantes bacterium]
MDERSKKAVDEAKEWLASRKGQDSLLQVIKEAEKRSSEFSECRQIDPKLLKEPFTI